MKGDYFAITLLNKIKLRTSLRKIATKINCLIAGSFFQELLSVTFYL